MTTTSQNGAEYFKTLRLVHIALIAGQLLFLGMSLVINLTGSMATDDPELENVFGYLVLGTLLLSFYLSRFFIGKRIEKLRTEPSLQARMDGYRTNLILRWGLLEGPAFFAITSNLLLNHWMFALAAVLLTLLLALESPTPARAIEQLQLNQADVKKLNDPNQPIATLRRK